MAGQCRLGAAIEERLHGLGGIHVLIAHKPARLIRSDRQDRQLERPVAVARATEVHAVAIARIAYEIDAPGRRFDHERRP